jgi:hypothetical protein
MGKTSSGQAETSFPGFEQLIALFNWGGQDSATAAQARTGLASVQTFMTNVQDVYHRAASRQLEAFLAANDHVAGLLSQLATIKEPEKILSIQLDITTSLSKAGLESVVAWTELTQQLVETRGELSAATSTSPRPKSAPASEA